MSRIVVYLDSRGSHGYRYHPSPGGVCGTGGSPRRTRSPSLLSLSLSLSRVCVCVCVCPPTRCLRPYELLQRARSHAVGAPRWVCRVVVVRTDVQHDGTAPQSRHRCCVCCAQPVATLRAPTMDRQRQGTQAVPDLRQRRPAGLEVVHPMYIYSKKEERTCKPEASVNSTISR